MPGVSPLINGVVDEMVQLAKAHGCHMPEDFPETTIAHYRSTTDTTSVMYQDFLARRPMEVETYLGSPLRLAKKVGVTLPRIEMLYALLHDKNQKNLKGDAPPSPGAMSHPLPRTSSLAPPGARPPNGMPPNGMKNPRMGGRAPSMTNGGPPMPRRGPYGNGYGRMNGSANGFPMMPYSRRGSAEGKDLEEFSHVMLYENGDGQDGSSGSYGEPSGGTPSSSELALRERELAIRQREIELREREQHVGPRRGPPPRRGPRPPQHGVFDDDDDEDDYFDPMSGGQGMGPGDENIDMLSITTRRHRKMPSGSGSFSQAPGPRNGNNIFQRKTRSSSRAMMHDMPSAHESIMNNPLLGYSSNRYGAVDRQALEAESRHNSISNARMDELARGPGGPYPGGPGGPYPRRTSQNAGNPLHLNTNGMRSAPALNGRPSPPGMRQPMPRHLSAHGNGAPLPVEQHVGVSNLYPLKEAPQVRSLTGSASASTGSGDSLSTKTGSDSSANSSASSLPPQPPPKANNGAPRM
jgi:Ketopantoate reductase PanE/ApbA C terminal